MTVVAQAARSSATAKIAGVMGWPVSHSKSPALHGFWLRRHGIDASYVRLPVAPQHLANELKQLVSVGFAGVNLTVPHKQAALSVMDHIEPVARRIGAINTVIVDDGRLIGANTDAYGFITNVRRGAPGLDQTAGPAVVLGAGGAARAVCVALLDAGCPEICLVNRNLDRAETLARDLDPRVRVHPWTARNAVQERAVFLVNTTSLGMQGQPPLDLDLSALPGAAVVHDIVYAPLRTRLLQDAATRGHVTVDGLGMLLYQAQAAFARWFGVTPDVTPELRAHVLGDA